jgi:hypothetical protein
VTDLYLLRELDGLRHEVSELRERVAILEAMNRNVARVKMRSAEELVQELKRRRNGQNPSRWTTTEPPVFYDEGRALGK